MTSAVAGSGRSADARNREALAALSARRGDGAQQLIWPIDVARYRSGVVGGGRTRRCRPADLSEQDHSGVRDDLNRPALSPREIEVLRAWLLLDSKLEVAQTLFISMGTVNTHLTRIRVKYADVDRPASTKAALVARAVQDGLIRLDEL